MFSYLLDSDDAETAAIARVRLEIGDTVEGAGVLPDGGNLSDEEIAVFLTQYANDVALATAALAGVLARRWSVLADVTVGPRSEKLSQVAQAWERQAATLAGGDAYGSFAMIPTRVDGYSAQVTAQEV